MKLTDTQLVLLSAASQREDCAIELLTAIAKARGWIDGIFRGRIACFADIAKREAQGERHIRLSATCRAPSTSPSLFLISLAMHAERSRLVH